MGWTTLMLLFQSRVSRGEVEWGEAPGALGEITRGGKTGRDGVRRLSERNDSSDFTVPSTADSAAADTLGDRVAGMRALARTRPLPGRGAGGALMGCVIAEP